MFICPERLSLESTARNQVVSVREAVINDALFSVKLFGSNVGGNMVSQSGISVNYIYPLD